jgi:inositol phosphorylceramide synthase regulatory subunit
MKVVAFAYFFVIDYLVNILYTILFASIWFLLVSNPDATSSLADKTLESVKDSAGFLDPVHTGVTQVHIIAEPNANPLNPGEHGTLIGQTGTLVDDGSASSTMNSLSILLFFLIIKLYFIVIVFSYARDLVLRSNLTSASFTLNSNLKEKVQRWMLSSGYWKEDDEDYKGSSRRL